MSDSQTSIISKPDTIKTSEIFRVLNKVGLTDGTRITDTLQGSIWRALACANKMKSVVIKCTNKALHDQSSAVVEGSIFTVQENILMEKSILKYLTQHQRCPDSIVKFECFFKTKSDYYLIMEDGGPTSLFDFTKKAHLLVRMGCIDRNEWHQTINVILKQMIECIMFIHSKNVVHFDISLENFLINDVPIKVNKYKDGKCQIRFVNEAIQIKLCDFGLAEKFPNSKCISSKWCGKSVYKSPEVTNHQKQFSAKKNDVWCMGICLLMMSSGATPWSTANKSDQAFAFFEECGIRCLLNSWGLTQIDQRFMYLFEAIFQCEANRPGLSEISEYVHRYV